MLRYKLRKEEHHLCITSLTLTEAFTKQTLSSKDRHQYKAVTRKLAIFVGSSNVAIVEHFEFVDLLETLDPWYPVPGRTALSKN